MKSTMNLVKSVFLFDGYRGTFIPQNFAEEMLNENLHSYRFTTENTRVLNHLLTELAEGHDNEWYFDNWNDILCHYNEIRKMSTNEIFYLTQDDNGGDLWLIHEDELEEWNAYENGIDVNEFKLVVDLDERGEYYCHVENWKEEVIWSADTESTSELIQDGFLPCVPHESIRHLESYLISMSIIDSDAVITF